MKRNVKKITLLMLITVMALLALAGCGGKTVIDLQEVIHVEPYGADGYGKVNDWMDEEMLLALIQTEEADDESVINAIEKLELLSQIEYTLNKNERLSNGDKITVTVTYPDTLEEVLDAKISPKSGESWIVEIKGLPEVHTFDIFQDFNVTFTGYNGYGIPQIQVNGGTPIGYTLSQEEGLSNGDVITITLTAPGGGDLIDYCTNDGFMVEYESMEYTVYGLKDAPQIDLFDEIDIVSEGRSPYVSLSIRGKYDRDGICYTLDGDVRNGELKAGESVTIRAFAKSDNRSLEDQCMEMLNALPIVDTYTYTIPEDYPCYITDGTQLTTEILEAAISEANDQFNSMEKAWGMAIQSVEYHAYYLQTAKHADVYGQEYVRLHILHKVDFTIEGEPGTSYNVVYFKNPYLDEDGTFRFDEVANQSRWFWEYGLENIYEFEQNEITAYAADYNYVIGK